VRVGSAAVIPALAPHPLGAARGQADFCQRAVRRQCPSQRGRALVPNRIVIQHKGTQRAVGHERARQRRRTRCANPIVIEIELLAATRGTGAHPERERSTMNVRATWMPPCKHPLLHTDNYHGAVGRERPRNGHCAPIADALATEMQLGVEIAPREHGHNGAPTDLCLLALVHCGQRLGYNGQLLGARHCQPAHRSEARGRNRMASQVRAGTCIRIPSRPSHRCTRRYDRRPAGRWGSQVGAGQLPD